MDGIWVSFSMSFTLAWAMKLLNLVHFLENWKLWIMAYPREGQFWSVTSMDGEQMDASLSKL